MLIGFTFSFPLCSTHSFFNGSYTSSLVGKDKKELSVANSFLFPNKEGSGSSLFSVVAVSHM